MLEIGKFNSLEVLETDGAIVTLDGDSHGHLPMAQRQCPANVSVGDMLDVFIYLDNLGDPIPTTQRPLAELGQVAWLKVVDTNNLGAFADWGLPRDLFIPFAEQQHRLAAGQYTLVKLYQDNQGRPAGSTRIDHWINDDARGLKRGQKVSLIIADRTELGIKAIVNNECWGLLYQNELYQKLRKGQSMDGYVQRLRDDNKVDLSLSQPGFSRGKMSAISDAILTALEANNGFLALTDKSPPADIHAALGVSKKVFKQAVGGLYKQRLIALEKDGMRRTDIDRESTDDVTT